MSVDIDRHLTPQTWGRVMNEEAQVSFVVQVITSWSQGRHRLGWEGRKKKNAGNSTFFIITLGIHPAVPMHPLWTQNLRMTWKDFWTLCNNSLGSEDELIRFWWSEVKGQGQFNLKSVPSLSIWYLKNTVKECTQIWVSGDCLCTVRPSSQSFAVK